MSALTRIADVVHKTAVTGLFGTFCYGSYVVYNQVRGGSGNSGDDGTTSRELQEHPQAGFINMLKTKAEEEYKKYYKIDHREWYDKDGTYINIQHGTMFTVYCSVK